MVGFQFLLGRLETTATLLDKLFEGGFQFLLGRLETVAAITAEINPNTFQFLLGRLETYTGSFGTSSMAMVSIPLR